MSRWKKKAGILLGVFVAAIAVCFVLTQNLLTGEEEKVYISMEESSLPVAYVETMGREMNLLHGYIQDMEGTVADSLTILPEDRNLSVRFSGYEGQITGIKYEIRSLDQTQLVERTELDTWNTEEDGVRASLPIQNLLSEDIRYQLCIIVSLDDGRQARYYTRIVWTDGTKAQEMVNLAMEFSDKTFDQNQARDLVTYLEVDPTADNSSLGHVTIHSDFSQLTWAGMDMEVLGEKQVTLKEADGIMGNVEVSYLVYESGKDQELYEVTENFTMKWDEKRIYLMNYDRTMDQIFSGERDLVSGKRILLGIQNDGNVQIVESGDGRYTAFAVNDDLWLYDQGQGRGDGSLTRVFSFRSQDREDARDNYGEHGIKVLKTGDSGSIDFMVYGYMNRGRHEGAMGVAVYQYREEMLEERFFFPTTSSYEELSADLSQLAYLDKNGMLYLYVADTVYGVDLKSNEYLVVADGLIDGGYAVSSDQSHLAWQEGRSLYGAEALHLMNLETGMKMDIPADYGGYVRLFGFVENDMIYGKAEQEDQWIVRGRVSDLPVFDLQIVDDSLNVQAEYKKEGIYVTNVQAEGGRIRLDQVVKSGTGFEKTGEDIIVCNAELESGEEQALGWYASNDRRKVYFIQLDHEVEGSEHLRLNAPKSVTYDAADILELKSGEWEQTVEYQAFGNGKMLGRTDNLAEAIGLCYDQMGYVKDQNGRIVWNRVDRGTSYQIKDGASAAAKMTKYLDTLETDGKQDNGVLIMSGKGATLHQVLYYVGKGCPVVAYEPDGSYLLITGYDQYNITVLDPDTGESRKMGLEDGDQYFASMKNDFVCALYK